MLSTGLYCYQRFPKSLMGGGGGFTETLGSERLVRSSQWALQISGLSRVSASRRFRSLAGCRRLGLLSGYYKVSGSGF